MITLEAIKDNPHIQMYLRRADENFAVLGYKEHGLRHAQLSSNVAKNVLTFLSRPDGEAELAAIAAYLHDIGHAVTIDDHAQMGAVLALDILEGMKFPKPEIFTIVNTIGCHEDKTSEIHSAVAAATILGDKTDVHRTRVRKKNPESFDTQDRVNYACERSFIRVDGKAGLIQLELSIDTAICSVTDYFQIFLERTLFAQKAAKKLGCRFSLTINNDKYL